MVAAWPRPELRRTYITFPWAHLYEHPVNVASVAVERRLPDGEDAVLLGQSVRQAWKSMRGPDQIDTFLQECKERPIERIGTFRRALRVSRYPWIIRRMLWRALRFELVRLPSGPQCGDSPAPSAFTQDWVRNRCHPLSSDDQRPSPLRVTLPRMATSTFGSSTITACSTGPQSPAPWPIWKRSSTTSCRIC